MSQSPPPPPPKWLDKLLRRFVAPHLREEVLGDLHERYALRVRRLGVRQARRTYWREVLAYGRPSMIKRKSSAYPQPFFTTMLHNYFVIARRTLARNKTYSFINILGLSIGLTAAMLIMLYTKDEVSYDRFHANNPHIYRFTYKAFSPDGGQEYQTGETGYLQGPKFSAAVPEILAYVRYKNHQHNIRQGTEVKSQATFLVDSGFFSVFTFPLLSGNPRTALQKPKSVVISEDVARTHFGTTDALGKTMLIQDSYNGNQPFEPYTVTGVAKKCPQNSSIKFDFLMSLVVKQEVMASSQSWFNTMLNTFILLSPKADVKLVEAKINRFYQADAGVQEAKVIMATKYDYKNRWEYSLQPFTDIHLNKELSALNGLADASNPMYSYILSGIALFILLIACINFVNLTVARSLKRAKEIGVRKVVGGGRPQLIVQFLGESYFLCLTAFILALGLLLSVLPTFNQLANKALAISYLLDAGLVGSYVALFMVTGFLAGFYPALVLSNYSPVQTLYKRFNLSGKNYLQQSLVVLQFALASFLIIAALTVYSQFIYLTTKDLGYRDDHVIRVDKSNLSLKEAKLFKEELTKNSNILSVASKNMGSWNTSAKINGETEISFLYETVDPEYLPLLAVPMVLGRNFSNAFPADSNQSVLVNETFVKKAGWKNPIGQVVNFWYNQNEKYTVVGVVRDYHFAGLTKEIKPQLFTMKQSNGFGTAFIRIKPNTETASLNHVEKTFKRLFPFIPYSYVFLDEENRKRYEAEAKWQQIILSGAILTIFISCIGLFGLATLSAERRTKEIGIRKVLGASMASIVRLLSSDFLKLVGLSLVVAFPAAWYAMHTWLQNYPYRTDLSLWLFAEAALTAILIACLTVSFQSIKAALRNPVTSLRTE